MIEIFDDSNEESRSWRNRYRKISKIVSNLDEDMKLEVSISTSLLLDRYFLNFPAVKNYLYEEEVTYELYHFLIPVIEDVLSEKGLFCEN